MSEYLFEEIQAEHLPDVREIYTYYILNSTATFHQHILSLAEMRELVFFDNPKYITYIILDQGKLCGYVLLTQHKKREAYDTTAEVTIYLQPNYTGKGLGSRALKFIEAKAVANGFHVLVATICGENEQSLKLFEKSGYTKCAHYKEVGRKFDRWLDLIAYQKIIAAK